jgi:hypothetical protein
LYAHNTHNAHTHTYTHTTPFFLHTHPYTHDTPSPLHTHTHNTCICYLSGGGTGGAKDPDWMRDTATSESFLTEKADPPSLAGAHTTITNAQFSLDLANFT